jgi:hypothetical protein
VKRVFSWRSPLCGSSKSYSIGQKGVVPLWLRGWPGFLSCEGFKSSRISRTRNSRFIMLAPEGGPEVILGVIVVDFPQSLFALALSSELSVAVDARAGRQGSIRNGGSRPGEARYFWLGPDKWQTAFPCNMLAVLFFRYPLRPCVMCQWRPRSIEGPRKAVFSRY